mmetsp:Transcript_17244/g.56353  ORF Transcript_17244/g.56353 Transcript_17244/m.56353 type:complete len:179 (-) Transcript_17244:163-699(-)
MRSSRESESDFFSFFLCFLPPSRSSSSTADESPGRGPPGDPGEPGVLGSPAPNLRASVARIVSSSLAALRFCRLASSKKAPPSPTARSSSYVPFSTMTPFFTTAIMSEYLMVDSRWAMVMEVYDDRCMMASSEACTTFSDALSSAEVASSSSSTAGCLMMARAMATRCFCPPESLPPP